jgi:hypothetical protein
MRIERDISSSACVIQVGKSTVGRTVLDWPLGYMPALSRQSPRFQRENPFPVSFNRGRRLSRYHADECFRNHYSGVEWKSRSGDVYSPGFIPTNYILWGCVGGWGKRPVNGLNPEPGEDQPPPAQDRSDWTSFRECLPNYPID